MRHNESSANRKSIALSALIKKKKMVRSYISNLAAYLKFLEQKNILNHSQEEQTSGNNQ